MEKKTDLEKLVGSQNLRLLIQEVISGNISQTKIELLSIKTKTHGIFEQLTREKASNETVIRKILDGWFKNYLCHKKENAFDTFLDMLRDEELELGYLTINMIKPDTYASGAIQFSRQISSAPNAMEDHGCLLNAKIWLKKYRMHFTIILLCAGLVGTIGIHVYNLETPKMDIQVETRSIRFKGSEIVEFHDGCEETQCMIPNLPENLHGNSGLFLERLGDRLNVILTCGGTNGRNDYKQVNCWYHVLCTEVWHLLPYKLNKNRLGSYMKQDGDSVVIIGGHSTGSGPNDCEENEEVLDRNNISAGWTVLESEKSSVLCSTSRNPLTELVLELPCACDI